MSNSDDLLSRLSGFRIGYIANPDKDETHSCNQSVRCPEHGPDVESGDLGLWGSAQNPGSQQGSSFPGTMLPGQMVYFLKGLGQTGGIILGQSNSVRNGNSQTPSGGGQDLTSGAIQELINQTINVNFPPNIQESTERGAKVRTIKEKGKQISLGAFDGLPNHGALFNMSGFRLPEIPNIPTAIQSNDGMVTQEMMQQITGQIMSIGQMLQGLKSNGNGGGGGSAAQGGGLGTGHSYYQDVLDALSPNMRTALNSLSELIQGHETDNGVGYVTGGMVHYGDFLQNATQLLSQTTNISDLLNVLQRLQWDTSLHGTLEPVVIEINNAWGTGLQEVYANGYITVTYANSNSQMNFANTYFHSNTGGGGAAVSAPKPSSSGSGSGSSGMSFGSIFGTASQTMQDMWKRLAMTQEQNATQLHQDLTSNQEAQVQNQLNKTTQQGGDVTSILQQEQEGSFSVSFGP